MAPLFFLSEIDSRDAGLRSPLHGEAEGRSEAFDHLQPIPLASTSTHNKGIDHEEYLAEILEELRANANQYGEGLHATHGWPRIGGAQFERTTDAYPRHYNRAIGGECQLIPF